MKKEIVKFNAPELQSIEASRADQIRATFEPMAEMLSEFEDAFNKVVAESETEVTEEVTARAKRLRIDIGKVRIATEKIRKDQKDEYLRAGKAIDGVSNILKWAITDKEDKLKEIEQHFVIKERERLERLQVERAELLSKYVEDAGDRNLCDMEEDVWDAYYKTKKQDHIDRIAAEKKAEKERIRIRKENAELKKQAEEREAKAKAEAAKRAKEEAERLAEEAAEREVLETKARKEREALEIKLKQQEEAAETERKAREAAEKVVQVKDADLKRLLHHYDTTIGLYCTDKDPATLLRMFWQRSSDACPLEASEAEEQEKLWAEWIQKITFQLTK